MYQKTAPVRKTQSPAECEEASPEMTHAVLVTHTRQMSSPYKCRKGQLGRSQDWEDCLIRGETAEKTT